MSILSRATLRKLCAFGLLCNITACESVMGRPGVGEQLSAQLRRAKVGCDPDLLMVLLCPIGLTFAAVGTVIVVAAAPVRLAATPWRERELAIKEVMGCVYEPATIRELGPPGGKIFVSRCEDYGAEPAPGCTGVCACYRTRCEHSRQEAEEMLRKRSE